MTKVKNSPAMMTIFGKITTIMRINACYLANHDFNLGRAVIRATSIFHESTSENLLDLAGSINHWLQKLGLSQDEVFERIANERLRQRQLFAERKISFSVSSRIVSAARKFRVLIEEIGEVAQAIDQLEQHPKSKFHRDHLITELVQVAAVAVAWLESLEVQS